MSQWARVVNILRRALGHIQAWDQDLVRNIQQMIDELVQSYGPPPGFVPVNVLELLESKEGQEKLCRLFEDYKAAREREAAFFANITPSAMAPELREMLTLEVQPLPKSVPDPAYEFKAYPPRFDDEGGK
jgi:hypothetical protein